MAAALDFYFDFSSPYSYLASERIDELAMRHGRTVVWHPLLLGILFRHWGTTPLVEQPGQGDYAPRDMARSARFMGVPFHYPSRFPVPTQQAARAFYSLADGDPALAKQFAHAVFRAYWVDDRDISAPDTVLDIAAGLGVDRAVLAEALATPELKARLQQVNDAAIAAGIFGAPWIVVDGEPFWGADRLPQIDAWLAQGGF